MDKIQIAKAVTNFVVGASVSHVVSSIVKNQLAPASKTQQVEIAVGAFVLGSMASDAARNHVSAEIEKFRTSWQNQKAVKAEK